MHAAHEVNGPCFAHAILTTSELLALLPATPEGNTTIRKVEIARQRGCEHDDAWEGRA